MKGGGAVQTAQRGQEIQPISVSLFSGGGGIGVGTGCPSCSEGARNTTYICKFVQWGGLRLSKLLRGGKKYNLYQ